MTLSLSLSLTLFLNDGDVDGDDNNNNDDDGFQVLEKIMEDPYSVSFLEPVDTTLYDDYLDVVEEPMCLNDVLGKLDKGEYSKYMQVRERERERESGEGIEQGVSRWGKSHLMGQ